LRDVVQNILAPEPDIELVELDTSEDASPQWSAGDHPDVVILSSQHPGEADLPLSLLLQSPRSRVLALGNDARCAFLYELRPHRTTLGELSRELLLSAIRMDGGSMEIEEA
jgi:hypothetical protein